MSGSPVDVVVIGGGIVGTAAAAFLAEAGASVLLVEREGLASGASGANSGVVQHPFDPILAALYRETLSLYRDLHDADLGFRIGAAASGLLYVSSDEAAGRLEARSLAAAFPDLHPEVFGGAALQDVEPALAPDLWACRVDIGYPVFPGASTYAYATLAEQRGLRVRVRVGRAATIDRRGDAVVGVVVDGVAHGADAVLVAAGPWSPEIIDPSGRWAPIRRRWGVVVEAELAAGPTHVLEEAEIGAVIGAQGPAHAEPTEVDDDANDAAEQVDFSLVPLLGLASVGSTFLTREPHPAAWIEPILTRAARFVPALSDAPIRGTRSCARPWSLDGRPLIGRMPGIGGLFVCAGHGSWGISTGPASARLVVDDILGRTPAIPTELDPARFGEP
jgi:glycine/D-amino acid oxidase-like deaminating enzyme